MAWFDALFGDEGSSASARRRERGDGQAEERDPFGRLAPEPAFDALRGAWQAGLGLFDLFGDKPVAIARTVGPKAPNRRPDVAKVETYLDRTGQYDLIRTDGPTGSYGSRLDQGIRLFQTANALKVDGTVKPEGPTIQRLGAVLLQPKASTTQASAAGAEATEPPHLAPVLDRIESIYRRRVEGLRRREMPTAADNLEHFLAGSGEPRRLPRDEIIKLKPLKEAEAENIERFEDRTFRGRTDKNPKVRMLTNLQNGVSYKFSDNWDRDLNIWDYAWNGAFADQDFAAALGRVQLVSEGQFHAERKGGEIVITGMVTHSVSDPYDFHPWQPGADGALALQWYRGAKPFVFESRWRQPVRAVVPVRNGRLGRPVVTWGEVAE